MAGVVGAKLVHADSRFVVMNAASTYAHENNLIHNKNFKFSYMEHEHV